MARAIPVNSDRIRDVAIAITAFSILRAAQDSFTRENENMVSALLEAMIKKLKEKQNASSVALSSCIRQMTELLVERKKLLVEIKKVDGQLAETNEKLNNALKPLIAQHPSVFNTLDQLVRNSLRAQAELLRAKAGEPSEIPRQGMEEDTASTTDGPASTNLNILP